MRPPLNTPLTTADAANAIARIAKLRHLAVESLSWRGRSRRAALRLNRAIHAYADHLATGEPAR